MNETKNTILKLVFEDRATHSKPSSRPTSGRAIFDRMPVSTLRHDLKTPLNAIIGYSELLLEDVLELGEELLVIRLNAIKDSGRLLNQSVNELFEAVETLDDLEEQKYEAHSIRHQVKTRAHLHTVRKECEMLVAEMDAMNLKGFEQDLQKIVASSQVFNTRFNAIFTDAPEPAETGGRANPPPSAGSHAMAVEELPQEVSSKSTTLGTGQKRRVLVVDDNIMNRDLLSRYLRRLNLDAITAEDGHQALELVASKPFDLILLDVVMPGIDGVQVLSRLKGAPKWRDIPVIMISALNEMESVANCIGLGADDYLHKPFDPTILKARINNCLERKRLSDLEKEHKQVLNETFGKYVSNAVRDEVLSGRIHMEGDKKDVTVLFADLRDFTPLTDSMPPKMVVKILNNYFTEMAPAIRFRHGSILQFHGDEIFAVFGAPNTLEDHPRQAVLAALDMRKRLIGVNKQLEAQGHAPLRHGIGIHSGQVVAANLGSSERLTYSLVGDTVNLASRVQDLTKQFDSDIIITAQNQFRLDDDIAVQALPATRVRGKELPIEIYKVL